MLLVNSWIFGMDQLLVVVGFFINLALAWWLVGVFEKDRNIKETRKEFLISEVEELRVDIKELLNGLYNNKYKTGELVPVFKLLNIKLQTLSKIVSSEIEVDLVPIENIIIYLRSKITESEEYIVGFKGNEKLVTSRKTKSFLLQLQSEYYPKIVLVMLEIKGK